MERKTARTLSGKLLKFATNWDAAISDANSMISEARLRIAELKQVIQVFTEKRDNGEAWPGASKLGDNPTEKR